MSRDKVTRLRQLLQEATPTKHEEPPGSGAEQEHWRRFQYFESFQAPAPLESDWRAGTVREITRIAGWYGWTAEIQRSLDIAGEMLLTALDDEALSALHLRMQHLEDCVQQGFGPPDAPPAN